MSLQRIFDPRGIAVIGASIEPSRPVAALWARAIFSGVRGRPPLDADALAAALVRLSELGWALPRACSEVDVNPLLVRPRGQGAVAADALLALRAAGSRTGSTVKTGRARCGCPIA